MGKLIKRRSKKTGLPPGTLVHVGERKAELMALSVFVYDDSASEEREVSTVEECLALRGTRTVTWINVTGLHDVDVIEKLGEGFGIHPLVLEDILNTDQRPKMEDYDSYLFLVLKMIYYGNGGEGEASGSIGIGNTDEEISIEQVSLILGPGYVISFQESREDVFEHVRGRIRSAKGRIRKMGADYLAYALVDAVVDNYFAVLEKSGEWIEEVEEDLMASPSPETLADIHALKRDMILLRKSISPLREVIGGMEKGGGLIEDSTRPYFRDIYDHVIQAVDSIETYRDMLSGMLDIYLSSVSNRMNEVMKVLTVIATIFIPITFIAGVYGMNFKVMPELGWRWGYPLTLLVMFMVALFMIFYFRKKRWF